MKWGVDEMINQLISILKNRDVVNYLIAIIIVPLSSTLFTQKINSYENELPILKKYTGGEVISIYLLSMSAVLLYVSDFLVFFLCNICVISIALNTVIIGILTLLLFITNWESVAWILFVYITYVIMGECGFKTYGDYFPITLIAITIMSMKPILKNKFVEEKYINLENEYSKEKRASGITYFYLCFSIPLIIQLYSRILGAILLIVLTFHAYIFFVHEIYHFRCSKIDIVVSGQLIDDISVYDIELIKQYIKINSPGREELFININNIQTITCHGNCQSIHKKSLLTMINNRNDESLYVFKKYL